jgi:hypothetical protein
VSFFAAFSPTKRRELSERRRDLEAETEAVRSEINQQVQTVQAGARVMDTMAGMVRILALNEKLARVEREQEAQ